MLLASEGLQLFVFIFIIKLYSVHLLSQHIFFLIIIRGINKNKNKLKFRFKEKKISHCNNRHEQLIPKTYKEIKQLEPKWRTGFEI